MLSSNNMLTTGGNRRQRARGTVRVNEPAYGFFIAGSSIDIMNGVYIRRNPPRVPIRDDLNPIVLYYEHEEGGWRMALTSLGEDESDDEEEDEQDFYYHYRPPKPKKPTHEWVFLDELDKERFAHEGDTIVPGAGTRWKHYKKPLPDDAGEKKSTRMSIDSEDSDSGVLESWMSPYQSQGVDTTEDSIEGAGSAATSTAVAEIKPDDMDELPWQVIAILDLDMVQQLVYSSRHRKQKVRDAKAGKNAPAPSRASLEAAAQPGKWIFRVTADEGVVLRTTPDDAAAEVGRRKRGEYVRGVELAGDGDWLRLEAAEDTRPLSRSDRFYNADHSRRSVWVRVGMDGANGAAFTFLEEVPPDETAVLDLKGLGDVTLSSGGEVLGVQAEPAGGCGLTGDLFDRPFVPRMEGTDNSGAAEVELAALHAGVEDPSLLAVKAAMRMTQWAGVPVGALVEVAGLRSRGGAQYNGVTGVVMAPLDTVTGRQGVRLDAPFSGKVLSCKPDSLMFVEAEEDVESSDDLERAANLLGIKLAQLGLDKKKGVPRTDGWGFAGNTTSDRLGCAVRSALRDVGTNVAAASALRDASELLMNQLIFDGTANATIVQPDAICARAPEMLLRAGALGTRAAAAVVSAVSPLSLEEQTAGVEALKELVQEERIRDRASDASIMVAVGEDSKGGDELLLRLALVQALLDGRREAEALEEARYAAKFHELIIADNEEFSPAVSFLLGRCLLRLGMRADGLSALERAERKSPDAELLCRPDWFRPVSLWGRSQAERLLVAHRAAEKCSGAAVDTYSRGAFVDAAALFARSLALLQAGFNDDKRGKATALTDRAGCLRRARQLDDAVADLDAALRLFPRYSRALFRRAACLLEAGKADMAVDAFKDLYRVDRDWPNLSEWLVRAFSLRKRQARGYQGSVEYEEPTTPTGENGPADGDVIAKEVDHYAVLGVSTDASEKQLKTAYRMRSLQFHPDRKAGSTGAFQRVAEAYEILSDADKRRAYDEGGDIKVKRGRRDEEDDSEEEDEEHKTSMREEVEREFYPERYHFWPFGDPFIYKRKLEAQKKNKEAKPAWQRDEW